MSDEVELVKIEKIFKVCPICGYQDGFHSMFEQVQDSNEYVWRFICPSCHKIFDIGLKVLIENQGAHKA